MPGLLSSPVCLTVIWFLSWSLGPSPAQALADEVSDVQYGHLKSNVTLACGKSQVRTPVEWHHNQSSALPGHTVTPEGSLVLLHADLSAQGDYSCYDNRGLLLHAVKLRLGHPPGRLNVSCRVPSHRRVRCSWVESVNTFLPAEYNASFRASGRAWVPCVVDIAHKHCDINNPDYWQPMHQLIITETNALGPQSTILQLKLDKLLKPDPPESVLVKELEGYPQRLLVSWRFPASWLADDAFPLAFEIRYRAQGSMYWLQRHSMTSPVMIYDALAGHVHQVQVRARDEVNSDSQWSEWSPLLYARPWEVYTTTGPAEQLLPEDEYPDGLFPVNTQPVAATAKPDSDDGDNLGLVIVLVVFSVVILATVVSLIFVVWVRQRRRDHVTKQELTSIVKMKPLPI